MRAFLVSFVVASVHASNIAGYTPPTNVVEHNEIDLDQQAIEAALVEDPPNYALATTIYADGQNSAKSSSMRTIKGFSKDLTGEVLFDQFKAYYGDNNHGDMWVTGALETTNVQYSSGRGGANFATVNDAATREQCIKKGTAYMIVWPYAVHELESAIGKCGDDTTGSLHYLDEAVAFYTGSLVGSDATGDTKGKLIYALAESRASDFVTCGSAGSYSASGLAEANSLVFAKFDEYKAAINTGTTASCATLAGLRDEIINYGFIPLIQATLKYARSSADGKGLKYEAEAAVFAATVLPRVHACSADDAATLYANLKIGAASCDFDAVKGALERNYACMGVTCEQIGGHYKDGAYVEGFAAGCTTLSTGLSTGALIGIIAGGAVGALLFLFLIYKLVCSKPKAAKPKASGAPDTGAAASA